jgi:hypothetical protein
MKYCAASYRKNSRAGSALGGGVNEYPPIANTRKVMCTAMVRPCTIEPHGEVTSLKVRVSAKQKRELEKKAEKRGLTVGALVREILEKAS